MPRRSKLQKNDYLHIRVNKDMKRDWKQYCLDRDITLTSMITAAANYYVNSVKGVVNNDR